MVWHLHSSSRVSFPALSCWLVSLSIWHSGIAYYKDNLDLCAGRLSSSLRHTYSAPVASDHFYRMITVVSFFLVFS
ncbi:hypothetical protein BKA58DRAFT_386421 [Alternaria rosae]|uniref:uncharacterized protein n=1 Tax=Alternaria rosae TaxID=1187941 RepID=UPI001E8E827E|nr:uncharacterized protein BKA58DRAFT_386421 [Alternaria rosae]KAH6868180.1 hypothetical protein BKA58DRAFT_386421 [Alternaria rosae]